MTKLKLSPNEVLILNVLQASKKPMERLDLIQKTGISDKNISAKIKILVTKGLIHTEKRQKGRSKVQTIELTKTGRQQKLVKIVIEKKIPKKEDVIAKYEKSKKQRIREKEEELSKLRQIPARELPEVKQKIKEKVKEITKIEHEKIKPKPLPATLELKKELRLLINLVLTHRKEEYKKYGYKTVSEIRAEINTLIDQLGG